MTNPRRPLATWIANPAEALLRPLGEGSGFSGARLWKVEHEGNDYVLRRWPHSAGSACRIAGICGLQLHLADAELPVPKPVLALNGGITLTRMHEGQKPETWSFSAWLPGVADYWENPRTEKLEAALKMLAQVHRSAAEYPYEDRYGGRRVDVSPAALKRIDKLEQLRSDNLASLKHGVRNGDDPTEKALANEALDLIRSSIEAAWQASQRWAFEKLSLQWRMGDVWHDHVLFTGDRVTGLIDFGAAGVDSPAGDVARLLGSFVGDDPERWRQGLAAYESMRPLSDVERDAVRYFDVSGTLLSTANWVAWLWPRFAAHAPEIVNRPAALNRLRQLVARLRVLASRGQ